MLQYIFFILKSLSWAHWMFVSKASCTSFLFFASTTMSSAYMSNTAKILHCLYHVSSCLIEQQGTEWVALQYSFIRTIPFNVLMSLQLCRAPRYFLRCCTVYCLCPTSLPVFMQAFVCLKCQRPLYRRQCKTFLLGSVWYLSHDSKLFTVWIIELPRQPSFPQDILETGKNHFASILNTDQQDCTF
jgi:hypothetical protein